MNLALAPWITLFGEGNPPIPEASAQGVLLEFPSKGSINYITTEKRHRNANAERLILRGRINTSSPGAEWVALGRVAGTGLDPNFRPILCADVTENEFGRWWPDEGILLRHGPFDRQWDLDPDRWTSVFGKRATDSKWSLRAFKKAIRRAQYGLTFGGGLAYGHGVRMSRGWATITISRFEFQ